jgi:hypothetical protein
MNPLLQLTRVLSVCTHYVQLNHAFVHVNQIVLARWLIERWSLNALQLCFVNHVLCT